MNDLRDSVFDEVIKQAKKNKKIIFLCNDMDVFSLINFKKKYPNRVINVGVSEQNLVNLAAGLASQGYMPVIYGILPFIIYRCFEQIKFNIDSMKLKILYIGIGAGHSFSWDGPTHYGVNDIGLINNLNFTDISNPIDDKTTKASVKKFFKNNKSLFIRIEKQKFHNLLYSGKLSDGFRFLKKNLNSKKLLLTSGYLCHKITELNDTNKNIDIIDLFYLNHFNKKKLEKIINQYNKISIVDENYEGSSIKEMLNNILLKESVSLYIPKNNQDLFYGSRDFPLKRFNILKQNLVDYF